MSAFLPSALGTAPPVPMRILETAAGARLAYRHRPRALGATGPALVFLGGFKSDMTGGKALYLDALAARQGWEYLRLDYQGHGASSGDFVDGTVGQWAADAHAVVTHATAGPLVLVGSSMGGWIMLLLARALTTGGLGAGDGDESGGRIAGLIGIAPAPDFTEDLMWEGFDAGIRATLERDGVYHQPSEYDDGPYPIAMKLIEDGRNRLLLRDESIPLAAPLRVLHGQRDAAVPWKRSLTLAEKYAGEDVVLSFIKDGDHRLSREADLERLGATVAALM